MKKNLIIIIITIILQVLIFYIIPILSYNEDPIDMVLFMLTLTFILSIITGFSVSKKYKYIYPVIGAILFIPSVYIYYNDSALIQSVWYLIDSLLGVLTGSMIKSLIKEK